jgi:L-serine dehydratase
MIPLYPEFFNDVFGPVMQAGSSSHMAGPCRLGYMAHTLLGETPQEIRILLDRRGSFAGTFGIMAEDRAMVAGALGLLPDDARLFRSFRMAEERGIAYDFEFGELEESRHPNAMKFVLTGESGRAVRLVGDSTGGGMVETRAVNGYPLRVKGDTHVVLILDPEETVEPAQVAGVAETLPDVVEVGVRNAAGWGRMHVITLSGVPDVDVVRAALPEARVLTMAPVLPVLTRPDRRPQLFDTMTRWREIAAEREEPLWEVAVQYEMAASGWARAEVLEMMRAIAQRMRRQTRAAYEEDVTVPESPFKPDLTAPWAAHMASSRRLTGDLMARTIQWAYGAGAGIPGVAGVAGPMGSGGGYVYAALSAVQEAHGFGDDDLLRGLFIAAGIGAIAFTRTEPTGECIGCSGECGICGAMAAAAIVEMAGGAPAQVENAASLSLQSAIGMPCDPIPGGLGQPCRSRIMAATCMAHVFADLALAGREAVLPLHEAIDVADRVGRALPPELLCTSRGGACTAPAAQRQMEAYEAWCAETPAEDMPPGNLI